MVSWDSQRLVCFAICFKTNIQKNTPRMMSVSHCVYDACLTLTDLWGFLPAPALNYSVDTWRCIGGIRRCGGGEEEGRFFII